MQVELVINSALTVERAIAAAPTRFPTMTVPLSDVAVLRCSVVASRASREVFRQTFADFETLMGESMEDNHRFLMLG